MTTLLFLGIRAAHVLLAALWIGSSVFISFLLMPAIEASGPSGGQVMARINREGFVTAYMMFVSTLTVVSGIYLLWRFTGFSPAIVIGSHAGLAFCVGGLAGVSASAIGGAVVGRNSRKLFAVMGEVVTTSDGPAKLALLSRATLLRQRMKLGSRVVIALQALALLLMSVGHYI